VQLALFDDEVDTAVDLVVLDRDVQVLDAQHLAAGGAAPGRGGGPEALGGALGSWGLWGTLGLWVTRGLWGTRGLGGRSSFRHAIHVRRAGRLPLRP